MKAVVVQTYGGPEVMKFEDYPDPAPGAGEVLVRIAAASVNPLDYKRRAGLAAGLIGVDMAGTVVIGPEASTAGADQAVATGVDAAIANLPPLDAVADAVDGRTAEKLIAKVRPAGVFATVLRAPQNAANLVA
jgi:NADPH:quinone reductase-like Zn-dependent oxidoreductase